VASLYPRFASQFKSAKNPQETAKKTGKDNGVILSVLTTPVPKERSSKFFDSPPAHQTVGLFALIECDSRGDGSGLGGAD
jgi:hypothetical protein